VHLFDRLSLSSLSRHMVAPALHWAATAVTNRASELPIIPVFLIAAQRLPNVSRRRVVRSVSAQKLMDGPAAWSNLIDGLALIPGGNLVETS